MTTYLLKTEPDDYSYDDLVRDGTTKWTGVANAAAQKHMRSIRAGDHAFIYHTGGEKRIAGLAKITSDAHPDPENPGQTAAGEPKSVLFDLEAVKPARKSCTLADIKADERFADFVLVKQARLSVMPVPADLARAIKAMAGL